MIKGINGILISSENPIRLIEFYRRIGIDLKVSDHGDGIHGEGDYGDVHFAIWGLNSRVGSLIWGTGEQSHKSNITFSLHVPKLEETYKELVGKGISFESEPRALPFGGVIAVLNDPDGNKIVMMRWQ